MLIILICFQLMTLPSSNGPGYPCPDCGKFLSDPPAVIRHRKSAHAYQPYHTARYHAKQARKRAEKKSGKANNTHDQLPQSIQNAPSPTATLSNMLTNGIYHDDFWKLIVDVPRRHASDLKGSQDVQLSVPVAAAPACDAPKTLHSDSDLSLPEVGQLQPSTPWTHDVNLLGSQLDTIVQPQSQALAQSWTAYGHTIPVAASDLRPFATPFPSSDVQSTYPGMGFQSLPAFSFTNDDPLSIPNQFTFPTASTVPSSSRISGNQFVFPNHMATTPLEPVPGPSSLSPANSDPLSQPDFFTSEPDKSFNSWYRSRNFA
jgi:hypothetical protein